MEIISREEAREKGLSLFFTGKQCRLGGIAPRRVSNGQCTCFYCKEKSKAWYRENKDTENYRNQKKRSSSKYYRSNKEKCKEAVYEWRDKNKGFWEWYSKEYYREVNKEQIYEKYRLYYKDNKHEYNRRLAERRAKVKKATPAWYKADEVAEIYKLADQLRDATGIDWDVDHMYPISAKKVCGLHVKENLQPMPSEMNNKKLNRIKYTEYLSWLEDFDGELFTPVYFEEARDGQ